MMVTYLSSRDAVYHDCLALDRRHVWDDGAVRASGRDDVIGKWLRGCVTRVNAFMLVAG